MKSRKIIKRVHEPTTFSDNKYYAFTRIGGIMQGYTIVTEGVLKEGDYFKNEIQDGKQMWIKAMGAIGDVIRNYGGAACRPIKSQR